MLPRSTPIEGSGGLQGRATGAWRQRRPTQADLAGRRAAGRLGGQGGSLRGPVRSTAKPTTRWAHAGLQLNWGPWGLVPPGSSPAASSAPSLQGPGRVAVLGTVTLRAACPQRELGAGGQTGTWTPPLQGLCAPQSPQQDQLHRLHVLCWTTTPHWLPPSGPPCPRPVPHPLPTDDLPQVLPPSRSWRMRGEAPPQLGLMQQDPKDHERCL